MKPDISNLIRARRVPSMEMWWEGEYYNGSQWCYCGWEPTKALALKAAQWHLERFQRGVGNEIREDS